jgi:hypothetical protein
MKTYLKKYAQLQAQIKDLEMQRDATKEIILEELHKNKLEKVESEYGKFTITTRRTFVYSEKVDALTEKVKLLKIKEEEKGIATPKYTEFITYTAPKSA